MSTTTRVLLAGARRLRTWLRRARRRLRWERNWANRHFDEPWLGRGISPEILEAQQSGWFPPGSRVLDAGCGEGDVAAWMASHGHVGMGVDLAHSAIARARRLHGERPFSLSFQRVDLCKRAPPGGPFQVIIDRGCFLQIPAWGRADYGRNLIAVSSHDARMLLFGRAFRDGVPVGDPAEIERRSAELLAAIGTDFEIERVAMTELDRHRGQRPETRRPGLVFWLRRRR